MRQFVGPFGKSETGESLKALRSRFRSCVMLFSQDYMIGRSIPLEAIIPLMAHGSLIGTTISLCRSGVVFVVSFLLDVVFFL